MASESTVPKSLELVLRSIDERKSFVLEAGAGSGKTWSLIESLRYILAKESKALRVGNRKIVCITYTNVAKNEISERIDFNPLVLVLTIHEFLWQEIAPFQKELKAEIAAFDKAKSKTPIEALDVLLASTPIVYTEYGRDFKNGKISHDDVLYFAKALFDKFPTISRIIAGKYPFLFVDEYQDTDPSIVELLLEKVLAQSKGRITLGFFGDSMQKIYNTGVGKVDHPALSRITKDENYRCSKAVIALLNRMRPELVQRPSGTNLPGHLTFIHSNDRPDDPANYIDALKYLESKRGWPIGSSGTKILMLTHKGIAEKLDYKQLIKVYTDRYSFGRERLYEKGERFSNFLLDKIEKLCDLYAQKDYSACFEILGSPAVVLRRHSDKAAFRDKMAALNDERVKGTIGSVIRLVIERGILPKPDPIKDFEARITASPLDEVGAQEKAFYDQLLAIPYAEVSNLYRFIEDKTPFSTKHGVKGAEFDRVLVVIDDTSWSQYSFNEVLAGRKEKKDRFARSLNLLYVCCSRAKDELAVLALSKLDAPALATAKEWFGNVLSVQSLPN